MKEEENKNIVFKQITRCYCEKGFSTYFSFVLLCLFFSFRLHQMRWSKHVSLSDMNCYWNKIKERNPFLFALPFYTSFLCVSFFSSFVLHCEITFHASKDTTTKMFFFFSFCRVSFAIPSLAVLANSTCDIIRFE